MTKSKKLLSATLFAALLSASAVYAMGRPKPQDPGTGGSAPAFTLGDVMANGSGCTRPVVEITDDRRGIRVFTDGFLTQADIASGKSMDRKTCNVMINATAVPAGFQLRVVEARFDGAYSLEAGATAQLSEEAFSTGSAGARAQQILGSASADLADSLQVSLGASASLGCGEAGALRVNTAVLVQGSQAINSRASDTRIDSLILRLELVPCA